MFHPFLWVCGLYSVSGSRRPVRGREFQSVSAPKGGGSADNTSSGVTALLCCCCGGNSNYRQAKTTLCTENLANKPGGKQPLTFLSQYCDCYDLAETDIPSKPKSQSETEIQYNKPSNPAGGFRTNKATENQSNRITVQFQFIIKVILMKSLL